MLMVRRRRFNTPGIASRGRCFRGCWRYSALLLGLFLACTVLFGPAPVLAASPAVTWQATAKVHWYAPGSGSGFGGVSAGLRENCMAVTDSDTMFINNEVWVYQNAPTGTSADWYVEAGVTVGHLRLTDGTFLIPRPPLFLGRAEECGVLRARHG